MKEKIVKALNDQMNMEYTSAYLYNAMASYLDETNHHGAKAWIENQAREEVEHADRFKKYLHDRGEKVTFTGIEEVKETFTSVVDVFKKGLEHEKMISESIRQIMYMAIEEKDLETQSFLRYFIDEQVEEEVNFTSIVETLEAVAEDKAALFMFESHLGARK